ncbi:MAG: glycosyltransferase family 2 protein [Prevotella sp.]|nr:glycosyltransferase family 2 protein [Prevotella sp.]
MTPPKLIIVVPCYNEEEVLPLTNQRMTEILNNMVNGSLIDVNSNVLYVDDGSRDKTWTIIENYHADNNHVKGVKLAGNSGHQNALMAGLYTAVEMGADITVTIDADLQDDVSVIPQMVESYLQGNDIVYGVRKERKTDSWFKRNTALAFYKMMKMLGVRSVYNHADFRLMSRRAVEQLMDYRERNLFLRGIVPLIGYKTEQVFYDRSERKAGESKYPLSKMVNFAIDGITSFSVKPVRLIFTLGLVFLFIALLISMWVIWSLIAHQTVAGWASLMLSIWFVGGCILIGLGIVGEYIGKIYIEVKDRPRYNIEKTL